MFDLLYCRNYVGAELSIVENIQVKRDATLTAKMEHPRFFMRRNRDLRILNILGQGRIGSVQGFWSDVRRYYVDQHMYATQL